jgi:hypothetical protein
LLGTFDSDGKVTVRNLSNPQGCILTLNITDVTKNQQICLCDNNTLVVSNSSVLELYNMDAKFINMIDLEDKISYVAVHGVYILAVMDTGKVSVIDWQANSKVAEASFDKVFEGQEISCGYLSKANQKIILGTKSGSVITIC